MALRYKYIVIVQYRILKVFIVGSSGCNIRNSVIRIYSARIPSIYIKINIDSLNNEFCTVAYCDTSFNFLSRLISFFIFRFADYIYTYRYCSA